MHPPGRELSALILAALFLFPGTQGIVRGQNTSDARAVDGGPVILDSRTVNDFGTIPVSITGIDSREVAASGIGSFNLNLNTTIATSGLLSLSGFSVDGAAALDRTSTLDNPSISEGGRRFLAKLLARLTDTQLHDLFTVARFTRRDPSATVDDWVNAFKHKRDEIANRTCEPTRLSSEVMK